MSFKRSRREVNARLEEKLHIAKHSPDKIFDLSDCAIADIPSGTYATCRVLLKEVLLLSGNELKSLKEENCLEDFLKLKFLTILDAHNNRITEIPEGISRLEKLEVLNLGGNLLGKLPDGICSLSHLRELYLNKNRLNKLPSRLGELTRLEILDVSQNSVQRLPDSIIDCRHLHTLVIDVDRMVYPPLVTCKLGLHAIVEYLRKATGRPDPSLSTDDIDSLVTFLQQGGSQPTSPSDPCVSKAFERISQQKDQKRKEQLMLDQEIMRHLEEQARLVAQASSNRAVLLKTIEKEQIEIDGKFMDAQQKIDVERRNLISSLVLFERHTQQLISDIIKFNEKARRAEMTLEKEESRRLSEWESLRIRREDYLQLRRNEIQAAMSDTLSQFYDLEKLRHVYERTRGVIADQALREDADTTDNVQSCLNYKDNEKQRLLSQILHDDAFQREAVESLLLQRDAKTNRVNAQMELIQKELLELSSIEMKKRDFKISEQKDMVDAQRKELSKLLMQLIEEKKKRAAQLHDTLHQMERERERSQSDYWMVQYQRLLDNKPQEIIDAERKLDVGVVKILYQSQGEHYLPVFAYHMITSLELLYCCNDGSLQKMGVFPIGLRMRILENIVKYQEKCGTDGSVRQSTSSMAPVETVVPSAPEFDTAAQEFFEVECVVCLASQCSVVFLPCGHVCCCPVCAALLRICPLCRADILQSVDTTTAHGVPFSFQSA